ncbi:hypothetical protein CYMTET_17501 [Cymbomonas tetramitiformis]|uniref:Uncharacterized protein n=1 Tax=Cymbomonas tetramitiformis TaxID=36881 RepID=A0AAE0GAK3_9CHLO|nr:hypothetical protein CYMTET_17501 [Cymbomonas tetramitiformis]|eukprot:gene15696-18611_t
MARFHLEDMSASGPDASDADAPAQQMNPGSNASEEREREENVSVPLEATEDLGLMEATAPVSTEHADAGATSPTDVFPKEVEASEDNEADSHSCQDDSGTASSAESALGSQDYVRMAGYEGGAGAAAHEGDDEEAA